MKKTCTTFVLLVFFALTSFAQLSIGPKIGINISTFKNNIEPDYRLGLNLGGFLNYRINNYLDIQPELLYSQQGSKLDIPVTNSNGTEEGKLQQKILIHCINIPIILKIFPYEGLNIEVGPQFGLQLKGKQTFKTSGVTLPLNESHNVEYLNLPDFALVFGLGYDFNCGLIASARYNLGLTHVTDNYFGNKQNRLFQISLGYKFKL